MSLLNAMIVCRTKTLTCNFHVKSALMKLLPSDAKCLNDLKIYSNFTMITVYGVSKITFLNCLVKHTQRHRCDQTHDSHKCERNFFDYMLIFITYSIHYGRLRRFNQISIDFTRKDCILFGSAATPLRVRWP